MSLTPRLDRLDKNYIINGGMDFAQRRPQIQNGIPGAGSISFANSDYSVVDRFSLAWNATVDGQYSIGQDQFNGLPVADPTLLQTLTIRGNATAGVSRYVVSQPIESGKAKELAGKTVTLSFWYNMDSTAIDTTISESFLRITTPTAQDDYTSLNIVEDITIEGNFTRDGTWRRFSRSYTIPASAVNGLAMVLRTAFDATATIAHSFTGFMILEGENNVPERYVYAGEDPAGERHLCERYYETEASPRSAEFWGDVTATRTYRMPVRFRTLKRGATVVNILSISKDAQFDDPTVSDIGGGGFRMNAVCNGTATGIRFGIEWEADSEIDI